MPHKDRHTGLLATSTCAGRVALKAAGSPITSWEGHVMKLSARNQIPARIVAINSGEAIANVELDANGVRLVASITVEAVRDLGLAEGSQVTAVIKASDVLVGIPD
jgi:molybdopterin-binding protein